MRPWTRTIAVMILALGADRLATLGTGYAVVGKDHITRPVDPVQINHIELSIRHHQTPSPYAASRG